MSTKARVRNFSSTNSFAMYRWASSIRLDGVALAGITTASIFTLIAAGFETNIGDADLARSFPHTTPRRILTQAVVDGLNREGLYIIDNVLSREELIAAHAGAEAVFTEGRMDITTNHSSIRQDRVCWVRELDGVTSSDMTAVKELHPGMLFCVQLLRGLSTELEDLGYNRSFNHLVPKQCQLSR